ncbi:MULTISPECIES: GNAT family N-acetyltransferase [Pseudomonas]|uniref:GNAT family N-acetyltransferase n=1 Tax=Pseudomonas quercus TaxID=2722792 RepID=A0ABX0YFF8_9PSED|nr:MULTISPECIES: GNAT family N-acetyltransferase [Pseudomonas]MBF7142396.1 GNAT family N-acetyltransferase [Pseudomonas sp. LY10J]NJP00934.1 GNAT family N-acetyltransferase [Pseudomonas quercus]
MSTIDIRPVQAKDQPFWHALWKAYQQFYEVNIPDAVSATTWQRILNAHEPINAALAWQDGQAVGLVHWIFHRSCWTVENSCYLQDLIVDKSQRGGGIGRQLIEYVYAQARTAGCTKVHWLTHETNTTAIALYEQIAEQPGFIQFRKAL